MCPASKIGPNQLCSCGSGKKYKQCCGSIDGPPVNKWKGLLVGVLIVFGVLAVLLVSAIQKDQAPARSLGTDLSTTPFSTNPGTAPPGKVWSAEHGHYHDIANTALPSSAGSLTTPLAPPPGPAPAGKVWSAEHEHYHDITNIGLPSSAGTVTTPIAPPPGPAPPDGI